MDTKSYLSSGHSLQVPVQRIITTHHTAYLADHCTTTSTTTYLFFQERMKIVNRRKKEEADAHFGNLLRKQVDDHTQRMNDGASDDQMFAALEDARVSENAD